MWVVAWNPHVCLQSDLHLFPDMIKMISWRGSQPGCGNSLPCPFCLNPDSIEHTFLHCQESKEFLSKTLRWFNEYYKENIQLSNKQMLFNTFDDSLPLQMPISTQRKLRLLVLLQKKYLYTCKNIVTKPNLEEFLRKLFEQYRIENCGKQYWICVATDRFFYYLFSNTLYFYCNLFVTYWRIYLLIYVLMLLICCQNIYIYMCLTCEITHK